MPVAGGPKITTTGILLEVDAANASSYTSGSSTWVNVFRPGTRNGTINGTLGFNQDDSKGALTFPGTASSYVDFGNIGDLSSAWSFQVAVKPAPSASGNYTILSYASGSNTGSWTYKLDYSSSNQSAVLSVYSATGSTQIVHQVTGSVPTGSWSIVNASYGNTVVGMYVNGRPTDYVLTTGSTVGYNVNNRLYLGGTFGTTSSYYTGSMASFFSYNTDVPNTQLIQNYNAYATRFGLPPSVLFPASVDPDAFRFLEIANITDPTQAAAVSNLVVGLKANSLWDKMVAIYPFVGGTAYSHKYNLKNPLDSDTADRLIFTGGWIHSSTGALPNGTNASTRTYSTGSSLNRGVGIYTNTTASGTSTMLGVVTDSSPSLHITTTSAEYALQYNNFAGRTYSLTNSRAFYQMHWNSVTSPTAIGYYNGTAVSSVNTSVSSQPFTFAIGRFSERGNQSIIFAFTSLALVPAEAASLHNLVQTYQTTLGRQV
jgi:hypothetical protein